MMLARVCKAGISPQVTSLLQSPVIPRTSKIHALRLFGNDARGTFTRTARRRPTIAESVTEPAGETAFNFGKGVVAGGAVLGLGALCYYGAGLSSATGAVDHAQLWPEYVKDRVRSTYAYFGGSIAASAVTATACLRSPKIMNALMRQSWVAVGVSLAAMIGSGMVVRSIPYQEGFGAKQIAWLAHAGTIGAILAPLSLLGGQLVIRAALYTAGVVGGLSTVAVCAPSDKFLNMGGPLAIGLGVVFASALGSMFLPPTTVLGSGLHSMTIYGGLVLFSMFLMYDTQRIIRNAETHPYYRGIGGPGAYDPINNAMSIYLDTVNIFVRILTMIAGGGGRRK